MRGPGGALTGRAGGAGRPGAAGPRGFSLVDVAVGVLLLDVGVLALASTASGAVRLAARGGREGAAALVASARLEQLRASACAGRAAGDSLAGPYAVRWSSSADGTQRVLQVTVSFADGGRTRGTRFEAVVECAP